MAKQTQQLLLMLVIGILIGTALVKVFSGDKAPSPEVTATTPATTPDKSGAALPAAGESLAGPSGSTKKEFPLPPSVPANSRVGISVADQSAAKTVTVTGLAVTETSWVAVYEEKDGKPSSILGAQKVNTGDTSALVELLRAEGTRSGQKYFAAILPDNGDGEFDRLTDLPPFSPDKVVIVSFFAR